MNNERGKKMKRKHTEKFIMKLAGEFGYTLYEVVRQVSNFIGCEVGAFYAIDYLSQFNATSIRHILNMNKL